MLDAIPGAGAFSGEEGLRVPFEHYIVNLRPSYADETTAMVGMFVHLPHGLTSHCIATC